MENMERDGSEGREERHSEEEEEGGKGGKETKRSCTSHRHTLLRRFPRQLKILRVTHYGVSGMTQQEGNNKA